MSKLTPETANYDEALVENYTLPVLSLDPATPVATTPEAARKAQGAWRDVFANGLYGALPPPPDRLEVTRHPLSVPGCERLALRVEVGGRDLSVDAALWLPPNASGRVPVVVVLDFLGPLGTLDSSDYPLDPNAVVARPEFLGRGHGPLVEVLRGTSAHRVPVGLLTRAGYAVMTSCYGSWVPDDPVASRKHGLWPLLDLDSRADAPGVVCLWSWAISRLVDAAASLPEIDVGRIATAGHSRLGKAALWAAANDTRIGALFLNESGCGGATLSRRNFGETFAHNRDGYPHWLLSAERAEAAGLDAVDQHQLLAALAPRKLYVASAAADLWCDPRGEYLSLKGAAPLWGAFGHNIDLPPVEEIFEPGNQLSEGQLGWHLREGGHDLTPYDWTRFIAFLKAT